MTRDDTKARDDRGKGDATKANWHEDVDTTAEEHADVKAEETRGKGDKASSNAYDKAFKAMFHRNPQLAIPLVREVFGHNHPANAPFELLNTAHVDIWGETYSDMTFRLGETVYHFECQSTTDSDIDRRMLQYDFSVSLERLGTRKPSQDGLDFPTSCLVHLRRHGKGKPICFPVRQPLVDDGEYGYAVLNAQAYSMDDIIDRHLLILFPFYLMRYDDKRLTAIEADESLTEKLVEECREARRCLEPAAFDMGGDALFRDIIQYAVQVSDKLLAGHENLKGKVRKAMGGDYIETLDEIIERQEAQIKTRDAQIKTKDAQLKTKDAQIKTKDAQIKTKDAQLKTLKRELDAVLSHVAALEHTLASL